MPDSAHSHDALSDVAISNKPQRLCPWWIGYLLASPVRRIFNNPRKMLAGHVRPGMTVLEPGPGMGFFTIELARLVGSTGRVIAVDIQPEMLGALRRRATGAGVLERVEIRQAMPDSLGLGELAPTVDFTLAFAVVHELPSAATFFREVADVSKPGARILVVEPKGHVTAAKFNDELRAARDAGFALLDSGEERRNTALLEKRS